MTMRVTQNTFYRMTLQNVLRQKERLYKVNQDIALGSTIGAPSDDAVSSITAQHANRVMSEVDQYDMNLKHARDWLDMGMSTMQNMSDIIASIKAKAEQYATGTYTPEQRAMGAAEASSFYDELIALGNMSVNGEYIFGGTDTDTPAVSSSIQTTGPAAAGAANAAPGLLHGTGAYTGLMSRSIALTVGAGFSGAPSGANPMAVDYSYMDDDGVTQTGTVTLTGTGSANSVAIADGVEIFAEDIKQWDAATGTVAQDSYSAGDTFTLTVGRHQGNNDVLEVNLSTGNRMQYNYNLDDLFRAQGDTSGGFENILDLLTKWEHELANDPTNGLGQSTSQELLTEVEQAQTNLLKYIADAGARVNRLDIREILLEDDFLRGIDRLGQVSDTPIEEAVIELSTLETMYQATLQATAMVSSRTLADYL